MKKLPTALTVPSSSFSVWLTIAPPEEASSPALGRLRGSPWPDCWLPCVSVALVAALPSPK